MRSYEVRKMNFAMNGRQKGEDKGRASDIQCRNTGPFAISKSQAIFAVCSHCLEQIVKGLELLIIRVEFRSELLHAAVRLVSRTIDTGDNSS